MIDQVKGRLISINETHIVIAMGGIGLIVNIPKPHLSKFKIGDKIKIFTYLNVREDALELYGFKNESQRNIFLMLISINGIGPKLAQTILSDIEPENLKSKIISGDIKSLKSISGVGPKTAKRIIIELKDKFTSADSNTLGFLEDRDTAIFDDVFKALVSLGYKEIEINKAIKKMSLDKEKNDDTSIENFIKKALKILNG
jgi:Holliday junction DNA helicase RuvA